MVSTITPTSSVEEINIGNIGKLSDIYYIKDNFGTLNDVDFNSDGTYLAVTGDSGPWVYRIEDRSLIGKFIEQDNPVWCVKWSPNNNIIATGNSNGTIRIWSVESRSLDLMFEFSGHTEPVSDIAWSPQGDKIASSSVDGTIIIWDLETEEQIRQIYVFESWSNALSWSPNGKKIAAGGQEYDSMNIAILDPLTGIVENYLLNESIWSIHWLQDNQHLVVSDRLGTITVWDTATALVSRTLVGLEGAVTDFDLSPKGNLLVSGGTADFSVHIWDVQTGEEVKLLHGHENWIWGVDWSPNGDLIASAGRERDGTVILWGINNSVSN